MTQNVRITELPRATTLDGTELVPIVQNGRTVAATARDVGAAGSVNPYEIAVWAPDTFTSSMEILYHVFAQTVAFPVSMAGSRAQLKIAATAQTDFTVNRNGSAIGTIRFAIAGTTGSFVGFSATTFVATDTIEVFAPASPDTTAAGLSLSLLGAR